LQRSKPIPKKPLKMIQEKLSKNGKFLRVAVKGGGKPQP
jgi:hypothetical protein